MIDSDSIFLNKSAKKKDKDFLHPVDSIDSPSERKQFNGYANVAVLEEATRTPSYKLKLRKYLDMTRKNVVRSIKRKRDRSML